MATPQQQQRPLGPFKLVTVNTAPERAQRLIGRVVEDVKERYTIVHAGNADGSSLVLLLFTSYLFWSFFLSFPL